MLNELELLCISLLAYVFSLVMAIRSNWTVVLTAYLQDFPKKVFGIFIDNFT